MTGTPTSHPTVAATKLVRVGVKYFVLNSALNPDYKPYQVSDCGPLAITALAVGALIILHSMYLWKMKFPSVRILADVCAFGCMSSGIFVLAEMEHTNRYYNAFLIDFATFGFSSGIVQLCDNVVYLLGYSCVRKDIPRWIWALLTSYIFVILFMTFFPHYTFFNLLLDHNSVFFKTYISPICVILRGFGLLAYDFGFSYHFCWILYKVNIARKMRLPKQSQIFVMKCVIHLFNSLSALAVLLLSKDSAYKTVKLMLGYLIQVTVGLHLLFNFKIESIVKAKWYAQLKGRAVRLVKQAFGMKVNQRVPSFGGGRLGGSQRVAVSAIED